MKFSVSSSELLKQLQVAGGAISSNPVLPVLEDFLFDIQNNQLTISSTNLETSIQTGIEVSADKDFKIAIPAKILIDTLKALPDQPLSFLINEENNAIEITSEFGKYNLAGDSPEDFPTIPEQDDTASIKIPSGSLNKAVNKTLFATSSDELRLAMTGVYVQVDFDNIIFVATDAHKLVKYTFGGLGSDQTTSFILPKKSLMLLKNAFTDDSDVLLSFNKQNAFFEFGNTKLVCRLIDAKYPDYNAVIPVDNPNTMTLNRVDFLNSLKRIAIYANKITNQVVLNIADASLNISAEDLDFSNAAKEQMTCSYTGEPMKIGFNAKFLLEMLSVLESDEIKLELSSPSRAGILLPSEAQENEQLLMLVMPVMMTE